MKNIKIGNLALVTTLACTSLTSFADDSFNWTGYMRTGGGYNSSFQNTIKEDEHHLGRFGNEYDTYIASALTKKWEMDNGSWAYYHLEFNYWDGDPAKHNAQWENDRNYVKMGGFSFLPEGSNIWAGTRKQEADVHILDYKWRRLKGTGLGYESKSFDIQFLQSDSGEDTSSVVPWHGDVAANTVAARARFGSFETELVYTAASDFDDVTFNEGTAESALTGTFIYGMDSFFGLTNGSGKIIGQVGTGVKADQLGSEQLNEDEDDKAYRLIFDGMFSPVSGMDVNPVLLYEVSDVESYADEETFLVAGARVHQAVTANVSWVFEGVVTDVDNQGGNADADGIKYKFALGPSLQLDMGYWARPVTRLMVTYIGGDEEVIVVNEDNDNSELRIGWEFEIWF